MENISTPTENQSSEQFSKQPLDFGQEDSLGAVSTLILVAGIISAVILFFSAALVTQHSPYGLESKTEISGGGLVLSIGTLVSSIVTYYALQVLANISKSLKRLVAKS